MSEAAPPLSPAERAMRGSIGELTSYLDEIGSGGWPERRIIFFDLRPFLPLPGETNEEASSRIQSATRNMQTLLTEKLDTQDVSPQRLTRLAKYLTQQLLPDEVPTEPFMKTKGSSDLTAIRESLARGGDQKEFAVVTLDGGTCAHCMPAEKRPANLSCDFTDPQQVRREQMVRYLLGLHELGHAIDLDNSYSNQIPIPPLNNLSELRAHSGMRKEALADTWMALMAIRDLGAEGRVGVEAFMAERSSTKVDAEHYTSSSLQAALDWAASHPEKLQRSTPRELMEQAARLAAATPQLTGAELIDLNTLRNVESKAQINGSIDTLMPPITLTPAIETQLQRQSASADMLEEALIRMESLNPLITEEWRQDTAHRADECKVRLPKPDQN